MPATNDLQARLDACRAILRASNDPAARIWNDELKKNHRRLLLLAAGLSEGLARERWESLSDAYRQRIKDAPAQFAAWGARMNRRPETLQ